MARFGIALLILVTLPASTAGAVEEIALDHQSELRIDGQIGGRLENAGDFDDDGIDDLLVLGTDRAYIVYGAAGYDYLDLSEPSARVSTITTAGLLDAAALGDVNGDDIGDVAVLSSEGAWVIFGGHGRANVQTPVPPSRGYELKLVAPGEAFYYAPRIFGVGDLNDDGLADIAVGEPGVASQETGRVTIVFGSASSTPVDLSAPGARGFRILGDEYDALGTAVTGPGDLDGDGRTDVVVKALGDGPDFSRPAVYAITLDGTGADIDLASGFHGFRIVGDPEAGPASLSEFVAGAGDVDRDGLSDILLPLGDAGSGALVVRGSSSEETVNVRYEPGPREVMITPPSSPEHYFGGAVAGGPGGDWNGDGNPDLLLGFRAGAYVVGGPYEGRSLTVDEAGPAVAATVEAFPYIHYGSGTSVTDGDFNGDGQLDLAVSAPAAELGGEPGVGAIYVAAGGGPRPRQGVCVERQTGSPAPDLLKGTNAGDLLETGARPDELRGLDGPDCLVAGEGDDVLLGAPGFDFLFGGPGRDLLDGGTGGDYLAGDAGDDALRGGDGNDMLDSGAGVDSLAGGLGDDVLDARDGEPDQVDCGPAGPLGGGDFVYTDPVDNIIGACSPYGPHVQLSDRWFLSSPYNPYPLSTGMGYDRSRDRFLVAWAEFTPHEQGSYAPVGEGRIVARVVDGRGFALGPVRQVRAAIPVLTDRDPALMEDVAVAALPNGAGFVVSWNEPQPGGSVRAASRVVRPNGVPYPAPRFLLAYTVIRGTTIDVVAARRGDGLLAMWDTPGTRGVYVRPLAPDGSVVGPQQFLRGPRRNSGPPALAAGGRGFLLAWTGRAKRVPFARRVGPSGREAGPVRRLGRGRRCCTGGGAVALAYDRDRRRYLAAWEAQDGVRTVLVRRGGRPIRRPRVYEGGRTLEMSDPQLAHGAGRFLLAIHELETTGDDRYPDAHDRTHTYWLNRRGRPAKDTLPYAGPHFSLAHSIGFSEREGRFMIASLTEGDPLEEENSPFAVLRIFARTWPGAPPE